MINCKLIYKACIILIPKPNKDSKIIIIIIKCELKHKTDIQLHVCVKQTLIARVSRA